MSSPSSGRTRLIKGCSEARGLCFGPVSLATDVHAAVTSLSWMLFWGKLAHFTAMIEEVDISVKEIRQQTAGA